MQRDGRTTIESRVPRLSRVLLYRVKRRKNEGTTANDGPPTTNNLADHRLATWGLASDC